MPSPSDPIRLWRRRERLTLAAGGCAVFAVLVWAFVPLAPVPEVSTEIHAPTFERFTHRSPLPLDRAAFAAKLWNPAPKPVTAIVVPEPRQAVAPPPRLQLIGIVNESAADDSSVLRAALYDPDTDRLHIVESGKSIGRVRVASVAVDAVRLDIDGREATLALRDETLPGRGP